MIYHRCRCRPIIPDSLGDSVIANMGSSREESNTPSEAVAQPVGDVLPDVTDAAALADSPSPYDGRTVGLICHWHLSLLSPQGVTRHGDRRSSDRGSSLGDWLGKVPSLPSGHLPHFVRLAPDALFGIPHIVLRTMPRHRTNLAFLSTMHASLSGLAFRSRLVCWRWDLGDGSTRYREIRRWMRPSSYIGTSA